MTQALLAAIILGFGLPLQVGINAQLRNTIGQPIVAAAISFAVGTLALLALTAAQRTTLPLADAARVPWWGWTGGILGAIYILGSIVIAPRLGAATFTIAIIAGQLGAALVVDHFGLLGFLRQPITLTRLLGAGLVFAGVLVMQRR